MEAAELALVQKISDQCDRIEGKLERSDAKLATKADASTVSELETRVRAVENTKSFWSGGGAVALGIVSLVLSVAAVAAAFTN